jgi:hypothetical protein
LSAPNFIERLLEISEGVTRCQSEIVFNNGNPIFDKPSNVMADLDFIDGVVGEILTMIDGR